MNKFLGENFLLESETAKKLFYEYAKDMPIYDYHNHLSAKEIYEDHKFENITEAWLKFDHYKWRAMRNLGIEEKYITGDASDIEKFRKWAYTLRRLIGNPLYHWTHLELRRYFEIYDILDENNADRIYDLVNEKLKEDKYSVRNLLKMMNAKYLNTTDDPIDDLKYHIKLREEGFDVVVRPSFRPDKALHVYKNDFGDYIKSIEDKFSTKLSNYDDLINFLIERLEYFYQNGARFADHGIEEVLFEKSKDYDLNAIYKKGLNNQYLTKQEVGAYMGDLLTKLAKEYRKRDMVMSFHIGPIRNNSTRMYEKTGADSGFDSMNDRNVASNLSQLLDTIDYNDQLPKTLLFNLNPKDNVTLATMAANFCDDYHPGKVQFATAWWFLDNIKGMKNQIEDMANAQVITTSVGMLTDSRSFLSFSRHEYYRRILSNFFAKLVENGEYPDDTEFLGSVIEDICYNNAYNFLEKKDDASE
ncbi:MAG: glucuronate isomerase [Tissierellia bacterium]|nr:glucuronate isomerase [Tissierellia bacterium]